jgi:hypothetical protein
MGARRERTKSPPGDLSASVDVTKELRIRAGRLPYAQRAVLTPASFLSVACPDPSPTCPPPTGIVVIAPPPGTTGDKEAIVDEATVIEATVIKVTVIDEVPVIEVTVIKPTAGNHGTTMDATTGKTTNTTTHATHVATAHAAHMPTAAADERATTATAPAAATAVDRHYCADMVGIHNILEVRRAC